MAEDSNIATSTRRMRGRRSYLSGLAAEASAERYYAGLGYTCVARRWRCPAGEIDLVFEGPEILVFAEVKAAATVDAAIASLRPRQLRRIGLAAEVFAAGWDDGRHVPFRIDLVAVAADGRPTVIENITAG